MTKQQALGYSLVVATLFAVAVGQILTSLNLLQNLIFYSIFGVYENGFLAAYTVGFYLCLLITQHARYSKVRITPAGLICFVVSLQCALTVGLASLALLWLIPWWMFSFGDDANSSATNTREPLFATDKISN